MRLWVIVDERAMPEYGEAIFGEDRTIFVLCYGEE